MRRGIGAIFTTGAALIGATVVVANPVSAPPSDVRVPAVKLSADNARSNTALDRALLETLTRDVGEANPAEPFKRVVADVVTNVAMLSGRAVDEAFWNQVPGNATPAQPAVPPSAVADLLRGKPAVDLPPGASPAVIQDQSLRQAVTSVADYVGYVSVQAVETTVAAARIAVARPRLIADRLAVLTDGDVDAAITSALRVVAVPIGPPSKIVTALRTEVRQRLTEVADILRRPTPSRPRRATRPAVTLSATVDGLTSLRGTFGHRRGLPLTARSATPTTSRAALPAEAPGIDTEATPTTVNGATDLSDGNKAVPRTRAAQSSVPQRVETSVNGVRTSLDRFADTLRKALSPYRPHRPAGAMPASAAPAASAPDAS